MAGSLAKIVAVCDRILRTRSAKDYEGALNGLQAQNSGRVRRIAAAVDANPAAVERAVACGADLLLVHHGLFWGGPSPWTGARYRMMKLLFEHDIAVYSSHLPLDSHPKLGNNALLCAALGLKGLKPFFQDHGSFWGLRSSTRVPLRELARRLRKAIGKEPVVLPFGPEVCRSIGVCSGGSGGRLREAAAEGVDTLVAGEGPHWTYSLAQELGVNVLYGGHYATETLGVKALAAALSREFRLPWEFLDQPSGL
ncbi:MAG: Nif3-like dinuclear metal center hexameric protein [Elusimicrobiota bacterium]